MALINHLTKRRKQGNKIILWTCRCGERLQDAVDWCKMYGLEFDAVNENLPEMIEKYGNDSRKIFYDVLIDDKSVNKPKYHVPYKEEKEMTIEEAINSLNDRCLDIEYYFAEHDRYMRNDDVELQEAIGIAIKCFEEIQQYHLIGTVEECMVAREKQIPKKYKKIQPCKSVNYYQCPCCGGLLHINENFCGECGNAIDWSDNE